MAPRSSALALTLNNLALVLKDTEDFEGAEALLREAAKINGSEKGVSSPSSRRHFLNLGAVLFRDGRHEEAETLLRRVLKEEELSSEGSDFNSGLTALALAELLCETDRATEGEALARDGITEMRQSFSAKHWRIADGLRIRGECLVQLNDLEAAQVLLTNAYKDHRRAQPIRPRSTRQALKSLIRFHESHGDEETVSRLRIEMRELPKDSLYLLEESS